MRQLLPLAALTVLLAGCASAPMPIPAGYNGPRAIIADTSSPVSDTKIHFFEVARIDGRTVLTSSGSTLMANHGRGFYMEPKLESREVPAGKCVLFIQGVTHVAADILAFGGNMFHVEGEVTVTLEEGKTYRTKGTLSKPYSAVWLEDDAGNIVSSKIEKGTPPSGP